MCDIKNKVISINGDVVEIQTKDKCLTIKADQITQVRFDHHKAMPSLKFLEKYTVSLDYIKDGTSFDFSKGDESIARSVYRELSNIVKKYSKEKED